MPPERRPRLHSGRFTGCARRRDSRRTPGGGTGGTGFELSGAGPLLHRIQGTTAKVKTTNGVSWMLSVSGSSNQVTVELARKASTSPVAFEIHGWTFPVTSGGLTFSTATGKGTIHPGAQTSPVATVDVTFQSTASKVVAGACTTGSETKYTGTLTGSVTLVTGISGGGTVSGSSFTASSSHPTVTVYKDCVAPSKCLPSSTAFDDDPSPLANPNLQGTGYHGNLFREVRGPGDHRR